MEARTNEDVHAIRWHAIEGPTELQVQVGNDPKSHFAESSAHQSSLRSSTLISRQLSDHHTTPEDVELFACS
jgi:hypothetical protein